MAIFRVNFFHVLNDANLNLQLDRILHLDFRFPDVVLKKEISKKEKWQCSQNLELNLTCVDLYRSYFINIPLL